jgi:DNA adenine methylase
MKPSRPLMNYYGGKFNLAPWIISQMPPHDVYVEAFGGALSVFMQKDPARLEIVNDKDLQIAGLYANLRSAANHLATLLDLTPYSRAEYYSAKERHGTSIDDSRKVFVASWMGIGNSLADSTNGFRNSKMSNTSPNRSWAKYVDEFEVFHNRIRNALIECLDFEELFKKYDTPETLWYLDPPYVFSTRSMQHADRGYSCEMDNSDHERLLEQIQNLKGMVLLSGYDSPVYHGLPWKRVEMEARTQRNGIRIECLWINPACEAAQSQMNLFKTVVSEPSQMKGNENG